MKKRIVPSLLACVMAAGTLGASASAEFQFSKQERVPLSVLAEKSNPFAELLKENNDPLYGVDQSSFDPNENVRVVVEVEVDKHAKSSPHAQVEKVKNVISGKKDSTSKVRHTFSKGFSGFSVDTTLGEVQKIAKLDGVKDVRISKQYEHTVVDSKELVEAMDTWTKYNTRGEGMVVAVVDSGVDHRHEAMQLSEEGKKAARLTEQNLQDEFQQTEVDEIWYTDKVPTGYDWADNDTNVIPTSNSHGTHVAGIVGAYKETKKKAEGVAPDVQLLAEKVFSDKGGGAYDDDIAAGIYHAVEMGADVINLSLGSDAGNVDPNDPVQRSIQYATEQGVLVVAAAGNAAYSTKNNLLARSQLPLANNPDIGLVGDPGVTPYALQVASSENDMMTVDGLRLSDGTLFGYQIQPGMKKLIGTLDPSKEYELVYVGEGDSAAVKDLDLKGKIAVAQPSRHYSTYTHIQKATGGKGAAAVMVVPPPEVTPYANLFFSPYFIPAVTTDQVNGNELTERLKSGEELTVQLTDEVLKVQNTATEPMSTFSSFGSPTDLSFKPEITAPGGKIFSTVINNEYETMSGTSMASPQVAGGAALLLQHYYQELGLPKEMETVLKAKNALMNTSETLTNPTNDHSVYSPRRQGSGIMKIDRAMETPYLLERSGVPLEQAASVALKEVGRSFDFTLNVEPLKKNLVKPQHQYEIVIDLMTDETTKQKHDGVEREYLTLHTVPVTGADIKINGKTYDPAKSYQYKPHRDEEVKISVELPEELSEGRFIEGFVRFVPKGSSVKDLTTLSVPIMGYYGDWDNMANVDESPVTGDAFLGYTVLFNEIDSLPLGYDPASGTFNKEKIGVSSRSTSEGAYPSFTALRNLKELSLSIQDEKGNTIKEISNFSEFTEDGTPFKFRKNIMSYRDYSYKMEGFFWNSTDDEGKTIPDGQYYYVYTSTLNYEGAEPQVTKIPIKVDSEAPKADDIKVEEMPDGNYHISWDLTDTGTGPLGSLLWVNGKSQRVQDGASEYISKVKPELVTISAIDNARNVGIAYQGDETYLNAEPLINYLGINNASSVSETKPLRLTLFGYKRLDWHLEITDAQGETLEEADIHNEHSIYNLPWVPDSDYPDGDYYVKVTVQDESGLTLSSEPRKFTVKR
ncbi:S8 family serine peptidase [Rossellomorea aquimaris]|uniref:S8 family serine peptidase n=1 Tax=Rossellomorea aquimaris TaxID=189382 RepID=A0A5D4TQG3_9BACI|nr:S8 family serine peptidase [Rossellomorea aquimaris]TYS76444.1 S8 family serine peptidase [Rossellomorea aquimaris]TYS83033.1 S8 family serine peptidase [Rossellomorea aquimaris]